MPDLRPHLVHEVDPDPNAGLVRVRHLATSAPPPSRVLGKHVERPPYLHARSERDERVERQYVPGTVRIATCVQGVQIEPLVRR